MTRSSRYQAHTIEVIAMDSLSTLLSISLTICLAVVILPIACATAETGANSSTDEAGGTKRPIDELPDLDEMRRGDLLEGLHPEFVDRIRLMYALLDEEGIEIVFVSGYRPHKNFDKPGRLGSWHNLGMAVDLNLAHRNSLEFHDEDEETWERIGEIAAGLGVIWGASFDDIFHFEWHPDHYARIRDHELQKFREIAGDDLDNYREVWPLFEPDEADPDIEECSGGCHQIPDDGLRSLLQSLR